MFLSASLITIAKHIKALVVMLTIFQKPALFAKSSLSGNLIMISTPVTIYKLKTSPKTKFNQNVY